MRLNLTKSGFDQVVQVDRAYQFAIFYHWENGDLFALHLRNRFYGKTTLNDDGSLSVAPGNPENPLTERLASDGRESLELQPDEWIDRQEVTASCARYHAYWKRGSDS